jgi:hypothetical protein
MIAVTSRIAIAVTLAVATLAVVPAVARSDDPVADPVSPPAASAASPSVDQNAPVKACTGPTSDRWQRLIDSSTDAWNGADSAISAPISGNRALWLFGDTLTTKNGTPGLVRNSAVITDQRGCSFQVVSPYRDFMPGPTATSDWYWPMSMTVANQSGDTTALTVFWQRLTRVNRSDNAQPVDGMFDFEAVATTMTTITVTGSTVQSSDPVTITRLRSPNEILWGAGTARSGQDLIVYGTRATGRPLEFGRELYVAKATQDPVTRVPSWTYWTGSTWSPDPRNATPVIDAVGGVSTTVSAHETDGRFTLVTKKDEFLGNAIVALTSTAPEGPFVERTLAESRSNDSEWQYAVAAHPHLHDAKGRILLTVSRLNPNHPLSDTDTYRPLFLDVPRQP